MASFLGSASFSEAKSSIRSKFNNSVNGGGFFSRSFEMPNHNGGRKNNLDDGGGVNNTGNGKNLSPGKIKRREEKRKERLTKLLHEYLAEEEKWLTKAQDYRLDGKVNLALSSMKIKKDYERSIDLLLEREGMDREEINAKRRSSEGFDLSGNGSFVARRPSFKTIAKTVGKLSQLRTGVGKDEVDASQCSSNGNSVLHINSSSVLHNNSSRLGSSGGGGDLSADSGVYDASGLKNKSRNSSFKKVAKSVGKIAKIFKKKKNQDLSSSPSNFDLVVNLPPSPQKPLPPLPTTLSTSSTTSKDHVPTPEPPPRRRSVHFSVTSLEDGVESGASSSNESSKNKTTSLLKRRSMLPSTASAETNISVELPPETLHEFTKELRSFRRKSDAVSGLLSSASSCDSDYDSEILCDLDRKWNASTPTEEVFEEELMRELEEEEQKGDNPCEGTAVSMDDLSDDSGNVDRLSPRMKYPNTPPAKPPRSLLEEQQQLQSSLQRRRSCPASHGKPPKCVKQLLSETKPKQPLEKPDRSRTALGTDAVDGDLEANLRTSPRRRLALGEQTKEQRQRQLKQQQKLNFEEQLKQRRQQELFDRLAGEEDEGIFTEESSANVTPEKPVRAKKSFRLSDIVQLQKQQQQQQQQQQQRPKGRVSFKDVVEKGIVIKSLASEVGHCAPTYASPIKKSIIKQQQQQQQQQQQLQQQPLLRHFEDEKPKLGRAVSWDRNAELWKAKRDAAEKQLEEVELEALKQFFQLDEGVEKRAEEPSTLSLRDFESRRVLLPV